MFSVDDYYLAIMVGLVVGFLVLMIPFFIGIVIHTFTRIISIEVDHYDLDD